MGARRHGNEAERAGNNQRAKLHDRDLASGGLPHSRGIDKSRNAGFITSTVGFLS